MKKNKTINPLKAIRIKCLDCVCGQTKEIRLCPSVNCPLYSFRNGHNPNRKGLGGKLVQNEPLLSENVKLAEENLK